MRTPFGNFSIFDQVLAGQRSQQPQNADYAVCHVQPVYTLDVLSIDLLMSEMAAGQRGY